GGLWVDYNLESTIPGMFVLGEANFSDHGANRLGASALMQGLADGYWVIPATIASHLAGRKLAPVGTDHPAFAQVEADSKARIDRMLAVGGSRSAFEMHRELGLICWEYCGMSRNAAGLNTALGKIRDLRGEFWNDLKLPGDGSGINQSLEHAGRVADFMEFAELMVTDALDREESCGGHFREEHQTPENEAKRNDEDFSYVAAWEFQGVDKPEILHKEQLDFENVKPSTRSYK
ncbi:MAG TPA: fumarate reductase/succinate dehydrogenase flavoprotein subunit, partial [Planctomycetota bacterium]|nr:fumarate reductase/succinate dehydrogenase flavoprotein subunit [Planctomycetota bacterium]